MTETKRQGSPTNSPRKPRKQSSPLQRAGASLRRYLLLGTGISSTALGMALLVSFFAAAQGGAAATEGVDVTQIEGRFTATTLDQPLDTFSPQLAPEAAVFQPAPPAPPLDVEREPETTPEATPEAVPAETQAVDETLPPSPPATDLDLEETVEPLDAVAAAIPEPLIAQEIAEEEAAAAEAAENATIAPPGALPVIGSMNGVNVTFYDCLAQGFCGDMYNGDPVYEGAAACSWDLPLGTQFVIEGDPTQRVYVCLDRGLLADTWVDIFFWAPQDGWVWQQYVGRYATIHIISLPTFDPES